MSLIYKLLGITCSLKISFNSSNNQRISMSIPRNEKKISSEKRNNENNKKDLRRSESTDSVISLGSAYSDLWPPFRSEDFLFYNDWDHSRYRQRLFR
jgi:hypothetical protein